MIIVYLCGVAGFGFHVYGDYEGKVLEPVFIGLMWPIIVFMRIAKWTDE